MVLITILLYPWHLFPWHLFLGPVVRFPVVVMCSALTHGQEDSACCAVPGDAAYPPTLRVVGWLWVVVGGGWW